MHRTMRAVHSQYAQRINRMRELKGHLWQGRYFSSALDSNYLLNAVRYVELNPVRAGLVKRAEDYTWSSAPAHCKLRNDVLLSANPLPGALQAITNWPQWLSEGISPEAREVLREHGPRNLPCGSEDFIAALEETSGLELRLRRRGGQPADQRPRR